MTDSSDLIIGTVLPNVLGTYSDVGNALVLAQRLAWRGINASIIDIGTEPNPPTGCDIYLIGGGEDAAQQFAAEWLRAQAGLRRAMATSSVVLAVCAGLQVLGSSFTDGSGHTRPGAGLLDLTTEPRTERAVGEVIARPTIPGVDLLTGFENHGGGTTLGPSLRPLAVVEHGVGNGSHRDDRSEGAVGDRIIATYLHGPVLARNPTLADHVLRLATGGGLPALNEPPELNDLRSTYIDRLRRTSRQPPRGRQRRSRRG